MSQFTGVSVATIRKVYRHALPRTFKPVTAQPIVLGVDYPLCIV